MMFRENVLIALTILITILALSFIILMTVYLQLHEMDERFKRFEKKQEELLLEANSTDTDDEGDEDNVKNGKFPVFKDEWFGSPQDIFALRSDIFKRGTRPPNEKTTTTTTTTEEPTPTYFGISDDPERPEPNGTIRFPFHFFGSSGHLTIEIPDADNSTDFGNLKIVKEVLKRLRKYYEKQKILELESRARFFSGFMAGPLGLFFPFNTRHDKYIWFEKEALKEIAPDAAITPRSANIIDIATSSGTGSSVRRRRKRSILIDLSKTNRFH